MKKFEQLCESLNVIKKTTIMHYPKQIKLSKDFQEALKREIFRYQKLNESKQGILNFNEKFLKAVRFHLHELTEKKVTKTQWRERKLKPIIDRLDLIKGVRKGMPPCSKIIQPEKGDKYQRSKEKQKMRKEINNA